MSQFRCPECLTTHATHVEFRHCACGIEVNEDIVSICKEEYTVYLLLRGKELYYGMTPLPEDTIWISKREIGKTNDTALARALPYDPTKRLSDYLTQCTKLQTFL